MIGNRLKEKRKALGVSQEEMALKLGVSRQYYGGIESNAEMPSLSKLIDIADILDVSTDWLLSGGAEKQEEAPESAESKYMIKTPKGWICTQASCGWRDRNGFCPGKGCMKEFQEKLEGSHNHVEH